MKKKAIGPFTAIGAIALAASLALAACVSQEPSSYNFV